MTRQRREPTKHCKLVPVCSSSCVWSCDHVPCRTVGKPHMNPFHISISYMTLSIKLFNQIGIKWPCEGTCCDSGSEHEGHGLGGSTNGGDKLCCTWSSARRGSLSDWLATPLPFPDPVLNWLRWKSDSDILSWKFYCLCLVLCKTSTCVFSPQRESPCGRVCVCVVCQQLHTVNGNHWDGDWSVNSLLTLFCAHFAALHTSMIPSR